MNCKTTPRVSDPSATESMPSHKSRATLVALSISTTGKKMLNAIIELIFASLCDAFSLENPSASLSSRLKACTMFIPVTCS